jgi:hypothetical protein
MLFLGTLYYRRDRSYKFGFEFARCIYPVAENKLVLAVIIFCVILPKASGMRSYPDC